MSEPQSRDNQGDRISGPGQTQSVQSDELLEDLTQLIRLLHRAEREEGPAPIQWELFRDSYLVPEWKRTVTVTEDVENVLLLAFREGIVWFPGTHDVERSTFPAKSVRLNRSHTEVEKILGSKSSADFHFRQWRSEASHCPRLSSETDARVGTLLPGYQRSHKVVCPGTWDGQVAVAVSIRPINPTEMGGGPCPDSKVKLP